jgi:RimJ/RimL family protein N-acetyltransferase
MVLVPDAPPAIAVRPVTAALADAVRVLQVAPGQADYVGDTAFNLAQAQADPLSEAMAVLAGDTVAGFYRLDFADNAVAGRSLGAPSVGLRAFMLDRAWQGRGLGTRATTALCADLQRRHPRRRLLLLTVNCRNVAAIAAYRRAGFVDSGELFRGGRAGPQHLMLRALGDCGVGQ